MRQHHKVKLRPREEDTSSSLSPAEEAVQVLIDGGSLQYACEVSGLTMQELQRYIRTRGGDTLWVRLHRSNSKRLTAEAGGVALEDYDLSDCVTNTRGQVVVPRPHWYTGRAKTKSIPLAHVVLLPTLGLTEVPKGKLVAILNGNPTDVRLENLCLMSRSEYARHQQQLRKQKEEKLQQRIERARSKQP